VALVSVLFIKEKPLRRTVDIQAAPEQARQQESTTAEPAPAGR
jgi:hypothetical protein